MFMVNDVINTDLELSSLFSSDLQMDRHKILFSRAFKRMANKTQVWSNAFGSDGHKYRTRLTHSLEVGSLSQVVSSKLGMNGLLSEIIGYAHDVGHAPFGHSGQDVLDYCLATVTNGKERFEHNDQAVRTFSIIENLNLSNEVMLGLCKRDQVKTASQFGEAQITDKCDAISYTAGDIEDAISLGYFDVDYISNDSNLANVLVEDGKSKGKSGSELVRHLHAGIITYLATDLVDTTNKNILEFGLTKDDTLGKQISERAERIVSFSQIGLLELQNLKRFMFANVYRSEQMITERKKSDAHLREVFYRMMDNKELLKGTSFYKRYEMGVTSFARMNCDYIAGCDDKFIMTL